MSNTEFLMVPNELAERAIDAFASIGMHDELLQLHEILDKPAEQHHGEPVACASVYVRWIGGKLTATVERFDSNQLPVGCLVDLYKYPPASADPGEAERLKELLKAYMNAEAEKGIELVKLRAQLAEREALLSEALEFVDAFKSGLGADRESCDKHGVVVWDRIQSLQDRAFTCQTPTGCACPGDGVGQCKRCPSASAEPSAPVEIDELTKFKQWASTEGNFDISPCNEKGCSDIFNDFSTQGAWNGWKARAALERKP